MKKGFYMISGEKLRFLSSGLWLEEDPSGLKVAWMFMKVKLTLAGTSES